MVLVTDAEMRQALVCIRALGRAGIPVAAADSERFSLGFFSRYSQKKMIYPNPKQDEQGFICSLLDFIKNNRVEYIIPIRDATMNAIVKRRSEIEQFTKLLIPDETALNLAGDKSAILDYAMKIGVPVPEKYSYTDLVDSKRLNVFPVIVKPIHSSGSRGLARCSSLEEFIFEYNRCVQVHGETVIEEMIPQEGEEMGFYALYDQESRMVASSVHQRLRSFPVSGGPSTVRVSVHNEKIENYGRRLLDSLHWVGPAMVEFKLDPRDGEPKLIEINTRFWGSLALDVAAGVNYPLLFNNLVSNKKVPAENSLHLGVKSRWLLPGDLLWFMKAEKNWKNVKSFFAFWQYKDDLLCLDDPFPIFGFFVVVLTYLVSREKMAYVFKRQ